MTTYIASALTKSASQEIDLRVASPMHTALAGGLGGAGVGGLVGLIQAIRKRKTLGEALDDTLADVALGGIGGAALGGAAGALNHGRLEKKLHDSPLYVPRAGSRRAEDLAIDNIRIPLGATTGNLLGLISDKELDAAKNVSNRHAIQGFLSDDMAPPTVYEVGR